MSETLRKEIERELACFGEAMRGLTLTVPADDPGLIFVRLGSMFKEGKLIPHDEHDAALASKDAEIEQWRERMEGKVAQAYQVIGFLLHLCDAFECDEAQRILDYFAEAEDSYDEEWNYDQHAIRAATQATTPTQHPRSDVPRPQTPGNRSGDPE